MNYSGVSFATSSSINLYSDGAQYYMNSTVGTTSAGAMTSSISGGAHEIDGSLASTMGFLLSCLFLMFGRKNKQPMMSA